MSIELTEGQIIAKTLQEIKDTLNGGITHRNMKSIRTFFVVSGQDSLDSDYPMYLPFNIPLTTQTVVSVYASFWLLPFRAYSKATQSNAQQTSSSGGGQTTSSGGSVEATSSSGGGSTPTSSSYDYGTRSSGATGAPLMYVVSKVNYDANGHVTSVETLEAPRPTHTHNVTIGSHSHTITISSHSHIVTIDSHTHTVANHTHTVDGHTHDITFGIYEENNSPSVTLFVSRDAGYTYPYEIGTYSANQYSLDITSFVDTPGSKMLKFESTALGRLSVQIEITLDVSR